MKKIPAKIRKKLEANGFTVSEEIMDGENEIEITKGDDGFAFSILEDDLEDVSYLDVLKEQLFTFYDEAEELETNTELLSEILAILEN